jgi:hypothetical protein
LIPDDHALLDSAGAVMSFQRFAIVGLALLAGGCAAAVPGYIPPDGYNKYRAAAPRGGGMDASGGYALTEQEQKLGCRQLTGSIAIKIRQMRETGSRVRPSAASTVIQGAVGPSSRGGTYGADHDRDRAEDRARLEALNAQLAAKKCPTFDIDAELRSESAELPRPAKPSGRPKS